jgi:hypothetical protein
MASSIDQHLSIPVVDFALARTGSDEDRRRVAKELYEAFRNVGFAYVKNHGVPEDVVDEAFLWVCRRSSSSFCSSHFMSWPERLSKDGKTHLIFIL